MNNKTPKKPNKVLKFIWKFLVGASLLFTIKFLIITVIIVWSLALANLSNAGLDISSFVYLTKFLLRLFLISSFILVVELFRRWAFGNPIKKKIKVEKDNE